MDTVRIYHPRLPGQSSDVPESALPHWSRSGWTSEKPDWAVQQEAEEQAARERAEQEDTDSETPEASGVSSSQPRRGRRSAKEGES